MSTQPISYILEPGDSTRYELIYSEHQHHFYKDRIMCAVTWLTQTRGGIMYTWPKGEAMEGMGYVKEKFAPYGHSLSSRSVGYILCDVYVRFPGSIGSLGNYSGFDAYMPHAPKHLAALEKFKADRELEDRYGFDHCQLYPPALLKSVDQQADHLLKQIAQFLWQGAERTPPVLEPYLLPLFDNIVAAKDIIKLSDPCKEYRIDIAEEEQKEGGA